MLGKYKPILENARTSANSRISRYGGCFLAIMGGVPCGSLVSASLRQSPRFEHLIERCFQFLAWGTDNAAPATMRATTTAIIPGQYDHDYHV
jgi:hypothetical protein